jgi:hypothetical protein
MYDLSERGALAVALKEARQCHIRSGVWDADDIAQSALISLLEVPGTKRKWSAREIGTAVYRNELGLKTEIAEAREILSVVIVMEMSELGRDVTDAEIDRLVAEIVADWPPGKRRPPDNFHVNVVPMSLSANVVSDEAVTIPAPPAADESFDWWEDELDTGFMTMIEAKERVWNHFAHDFGVARSPEGLISVIGATEARSSVALRGGALAVARQMLDAGPDADWTDPFFLPWPFASTGQRARIAEFLLERRRYAEGLWESAMETATGKDRPGPAEPGDDVSNLYWQDSM